MDATLSMGDESGSVDRHQNLPGSRGLAANPNRVQAERECVDQAPYQLDPVRRDTARPLSPHPAQIGAQDDEACRMISWNRRFRGEGQSCVAS